MDLSVIIVNYNVRPFLENALVAIMRALQGLDGEIIVVDNASDDGSAEMVRAKFPEVQLIEMGENLGFSRANNVALKKSRGNFLLLINPDTIIQEDTLRVMISFFAAHPDAGLAGCRILNPDGTFQLPCRRSFPTPWVAFTKIFGLSSLFPRTRLFGRYNLTYLSPDATYAVDAVSGSFMMIRRDVLEKVGGLDESFFMYGEDIDWCYRVAQAGFKVYYVHETAIVHFKGESTRRSNIDELKHFYGAMELFVEKHYTHSAIVRFFLKSGIALRGLAATLARAGRPAATALFDGMLLDLALFLSAYWYFASPTLFTFNAHPAVWIVPAGILVTVGSRLGLYGAYRHSIARAGLAVVVSYLLISALVFFAKDFAYSRIVVVLSGLLTFLFVPGWRLFRVARKGGGAAVGRPSLFGSRTLVVGTGPVVEDVMRKLRARVVNEYEVVGLIDVNRKRLGEHVAGVEIVGSVENIGRVINDMRVSEVIFAMDDRLSYTDILGVIARSSAPGVNFRLVPNSGEAILGKTRIDELAPLVDIEYNLSRPWNRAAKRGFDLLFSLILLPIAYIPVRVAVLLGWRPSPNGKAEAALTLPRICMGTMSFVGLPAGGLASSASQVQSFLGKQGLTGIIQIHEQEDLRPDERERFALYYAKNQSIGLDLEILLKAMLLRKYRE